MNNLLLRTCTAFVLAAIALSVTYIGGFLFDAFIIILCGLVFLEYQSIVQPYYGYVRRLVGWGFYAIISLLLLLNSPAVIIWLLVFGFALTLGCSSFYLAAEKILAARFQYAFWCSLGFLYSVVPMLALIYLRKIEINSIVYLFAIVWGSDIGGYFGGKLLGGPKLAPKISPKKTWSGSIVGACVALIFATLVNYTMGSPAIISSRFVFCGIIFAVISQVGDLFESMIKRYFSVKDSGVLLPGHGGVLDRVDGLLFASIGLALVIYLSQGHVGFL